MSATSTVYVRFVRSGDARQPKQAYHDDAGWDLSIVEEVTLKPGESRDIKTGVWAAFPDGHWGFIMSRSSVMRKYRVHITPAVIDAGFRGELMVLATNLGTEPVTFRPGDRLAQVILVGVPRVEWVEQATLPPGSREDRGFGSSGLGDYRHVGSAPEVNRHALLAVSAIEAVKLLTEDQLEQLAYDFELGLTDGRAGLVRQFEKMKGD